jgi:hypothetical protein
MSPPSFFDLPRLRYRYHPEPAEPDAVVAQRPRGSRRPHTDARVATVRRLIEETTLTYGEIAKRSGVGRASICRWTRDQGWRRPPFAPRATDTVPTARASAKLRRRTLAARLTALAERHIAELEAAQCVEADKLGEALELYRIAKLAAMGRRRRRKDGAVSLAAPDGGPRRPMGELLVAGVDFSRAPRGAVEDYLTNRNVPTEEEKPPRRTRPGKRYSRYKTAEYHQWLLEKE